MEASALYDYSTISIYYINKNIKNCIMHLSPPFRGKEAEENQDL